MQGSNRVKVHIVNEALAFGLAGSSPVCVGGASNIFLVSSSRSLVLALGFVVCTIFKESMKSVLSLVDRFKLDL